MASCSAVEQSNFMELTPASLRGSFMKLWSLLSCAAICLSTVAVASSPEAAKTEPARYLEFEDSQLRVFRIHYGPGERSLTPGPFATTGKAHHTSAFIQTADDGPFDAVLIELKSRRQLPPGNLKSHHQRSSAALATQLARIETSAARPTHR
jgi:hypothetical protein